MFKCGKQISFNKELFSTELVIYKIKKLCYFTFRKPVFLIGCGSLYEMKTINVKSRTLQAGISLKFLAGVKQIGATETSG